VVTQIRRGQLKKKNPAGSKGRRNAGMNEWRELSAHDEKKVKAATGPDLQKPI